MIDRVGIILEAKVINNNDERCFYFQLKCKWAPGENMPFACQLKKYFAEEFTPYDFLRQP